MHGVTYVGHNSVACDESNVVLKRKPPIRHGWHARCTVGGNCFFRAHTSCGVGDVWGAGTWCSQIPRDVAAHNWSTIENYRSVYHHFYSIYRQQYLLDHFPRRQCVEGREAQLIGCQSISGRTHLWRVFDSSASTHKPRDKLKHWFTRRCCASSTRTIKQLGNP